MKKVVIQIRDKKDNHINYERIILKINTRFWIGFIWVNMLRKNEYIEYHDLKSLSQNIEDK